MTTPQTTQVAYPVQQPQVIAVQQTNPRNMNVAAVRGLAITQIVFGALTIGFGIGAIAGFKYGYWVNGSGSGIWFGIWILITGIIGVFSAKNPSHNGLNGTNMGFSIVCTVVSFFVGIFFVVAVVYYSSCTEYYWRSGYYGYDYGYYGDYYCTGDKDAGVAIYSILLILMIAEFFVSLIASVYCCSGGCCGTQSSGVIIQQQQPMQTTLVATSTQGVTSQYQTYPVASYPVASYPVASYPNQQQPMYSAAGYPPQSVAYPPQSGAYPAQQFATTNAPMGMANTNITYSAEQQQQQNFAKQAPPPAYTA